jgi:hypothetical protein
MREERMLHAVVQMLLLAGGTVAGWFWDENAPNFAVIQMAIAVLIFTLFIIFLAFWPFFWWVKLIRRNAATRGARKTADKP